MGRTLAIGDVHLPFANRRAILNVLKLARRLKPTRILQLGDLFDLYSFSRFARSPNLMTPAQEVRRGRQQAEELWAELRRASGSKVECFQLIGNHDERIAKRAAEAVPELERFLSHVAHLWQFDGVTTQPSERHELILDGVVYMHGHRRHGEHVRYNLMSTVVGHSHVGGVVFHRQRNKTLFELNAGYLGSSSALPMSYGRQKQFSRWTTGVGLIGDDGPRFIPL